MSKLEAVLAEQIAIFGLPDPYEQFRFHDVRRWRADFAWPEHKLIVEVQGGTWTGGGHVRGKGYKNDCDKLNACQEIGYTVFWFTTDHIKSGEAIQTIQRFFHADDKATEKAGQ